jgi:hypothetical protein
MGGEGYLKNKISELKNIKTRIPETYAKAYIP